MHLSPAASLHTLFLRDGVSRVWKRLLAALFLAWVPCLASAQTVFTFPTPVAVGSATAETGTVTVTVATAGTLATIASLTQGSAGLDFSVIAGGTCAAGTSYSVNGQCTVEVSFQPTYPGPRHGAVVLRASDNTPLATSYLEGSATGSLSVLVKGEIGTVAGSGAWIYDLDNVPAIQASIFEPQGEVTDAAGNLYVADTRNNRIRRVDAATGTITTIAGGYSVGATGDGGPGTAASLYNPTALALDGAGNLYICDSGNNEIRVLNLGTGIIDRVAGVFDTQGQYSGDGGSALLAHFAFAPVGSGLALDTAHRLYVSDVQNNVIRRIDLTTGTITRFAGTGAPGYSGDYGQAVNATLGTPLGINFGGDGSLYIADSGNLVVRKVSPAGVITTVAGGGMTLGDGGPALQASLNSPAAVALDQADNLYIADTLANIIRKVNAGTQIIETIAGTGGQQFAGDGLNADQAQFYGPYSIFFDGKGNLFIGDMFHHRIREINGSLATFAYDPIRAGRTSPPKLELLENDGNADLNLGTPAFVNAALDPATTSCILPGTLTQGSSCVLGVAFAPLMPANPATGNVTLPSNAADSPARINVSGKALLVDPTTTTLASSLNPSVQGSAVLFKATVITQGTTLTGNVEFYDNGTTDLGGATLTASGNKGTAQITTSTLPLGLNSITAVYQGDPTNGTSTSLPVLQFVKQTSTTALTSSFNPSVEGSAVLLTATITATGSVMPTGQVTFLDGGTTLGTGTLDASGVATFSISTLTIGTHPLKASYAGDTNNSPSTSGALPQVVLGQGSSIALSTSNAEVPLGTSVTFSVQVTGTGTATATGTVVFKDGSTSLGTATLNGTAGASLTTATLAAGSHTISAVYQGDANYAGSTSAPLLEVMDQLPTAVSLTSSANPSAAGAATVLSATVTTAAGGTGGTITGTVTFLNAGATIGTAAVGANGVATLKIANLPLGGDNLSAGYGGNTNYQKSASAPLTETIVQATSATALASSLNPSIVEGPITLTATVTTNGGLATGPVTFNDGGTVLGTAALNGQGVAAITVTSLIVGPHTLTATYAGDALDLPSSSPGLTQTVLLHPSTDGLTSSATSLSGGQQVTLISVVEWTDAIVPTGTVTFYAGATTLGAAPVDATGVATLTILPQPGLTTVHAVYSGDAVFAGSTSKDIAITVGMPPQFTIAATPTAMSVVSLDHSTVQVTVASVKGFSDKLAFGCLGLPKAATCTFSVDWTMLAANGTSGLTVVVDTGSPLTAGSVAKNEAPRRSLVALCGLPLSALLCLLVRRKRRWAGLLLAVCTLGVSAGLAGCGTLVINGTPPGTYPFQITAAAQGAGVIEAVNMTLTVTK